jgi:hypothetical protein
MRCVTGRLRSVKGFSCDAAAGGIVYAVQDGAQIINASLRSSVPCQNPKRLAHLAAQESVRELTPGERATFGVS